MNESDNQPERIVLNCSECAVVVGDRMICPHGKVWHADLAAPTIDSTCEWKYQGARYWRTNCQKYIQLADGAPVDSRWKFCPFCGKEIK